MWMDLESNTGVCAACGPVALGWKNIRGERVPRCGVAVKEQRQDGKRKSRSNYNNRRKPHGLTGKQAREFVADKICAICGDPRTVVDHCHQSNQIRGALCRLCNAGLGFFRDNTEFLYRARLYLQMFNLDRTA